MGRGPQKMPPFFLSPLPPLPLFLVLNGWFRQWMSLFYLMFSFGLCYGGHLFVLFSVLIGLCQYTVGVSSVKCSY